MLSIIIPVYNEVASLRQLYEELHWATAYLSVPLPPRNGGREGEGGRGGGAPLTYRPSPSRSPSPHGGEGEDHTTPHPAPTELIFIDDGSTDGSWEILADLASADPRVTAVRLRRNCGKATAYAAGLQHARGDIIATMDADLQDDPRELPRMLEELTPPVSLRAERSAAKQSRGLQDVAGIPSVAGLPRNDTGYDLIVGWKENRQDTRIKVWSSRFFNALLRRVAGTILHDHNSGFRVMRRDVADALPLRGDLHRVIPAVAAMYGFRVAEVPVAHRLRPYGTSRYGRTGLRRWFHGLADLATVAFLMRYRSRPLHFFGGWGLTLLAIGIVINAYLTVLWLGGSSIGRRPLLLLGILCMVLGVQLISTGFLADLLLSRAPREDPPIAEVRRRRSGE